MITHRCRIDGAASVYENLVASQDELTIGAVITYGSVVAPQEVTSVIQGYDNATVTETRTDRPVVAVCGAGTFGRALLLPALQRVPGLRLKTLVTERGGAASHVAKKYQFENHSTDFATVLVDPEIDAIIVATPHRLHAQMVANALDAGKHVFVEKPLCVDEQQLKMVQEAFYRVPSAQSLNLTVGYNRRHSRHALWAREAFAGRSTPMVGHYRISPGFLPPDHWVNDPAEGGGRVIGEACHFVDLLLFLTGSEPTRVYAERIDASGTAAVSNDNFVATITFADGSVGAITYAAVGDRGHSREYFEIFADGKSLTVRDFRRSALHGSGRRRRFVTRGQDMGYEAELRKFFDIVRCPEHLRIHRNAEDQFLSTLATLRLADALRTGKPTDLIS
jgi:polar amino acid transport system substrate-binding protein